MANRLSRVFWAMGQALLPAHLRTQEESLLADSAVRFNLQEAPAYGIYRLQWNETLLNEGVLSLEELTLVMPSGLLLKLQENAQLSPLNLNNAGGVLLPVFIHIRSAPDYSGLPSNGLRTILRDNVNCWLWSLELSTEQDNPDTLESFRLAEFEKRPDGVWQLATRYIPPLASLGGVPFLKEELLRLSQMLEAYHYQLSQEITAIYLSGSDHINSRQALKSVVNFQRFLANVLTEITPHPYTVYEKLKQFYVDLCFYHDSMPQSAITPYRHERLAEVFAESLTLLYGQIQFNQLRSPYLPFSVAGGIVSAKLPESLREAKEVYLLVQKSSVTKRVQLDNIKLSALSRLPIIHKFYLLGIPCKHIERPPFQHSFGPEIEIFQLSLGDEWDYALKELSVGFYSDPAWLEENFFLHWRSI